MSDIDANTVGLHHRDPRDTERLAALRQMPNTGTARRRVYDYIEAQGGATDDEIMSALMMNPNTARPRRVELVDGGHIEDSGKRRPTESGSPAIVWVVTGKEAAVPTAKAKKKTKPKGGWKRSDWPRAGEGKVVRGFCLLHTSHFCPCAAPSLYRVGR